MTAGNQPSSSGSGDALLPCPFCGGMDLDTRGDNAIFCKNLRCEAGIDIGHAVGHEARQDVTRRWGARCAAQAEPERLPTHGNLLAEINKAAHAAGTNAWVRDVLKQAHRAIRLNAPLAAVTPSPGPGEDWSERLAERVMQLQAAGAETLTCAQFLGLIAFVRDGEGSAVTSTEDKSPKYKLDELLADMTPDNVHSEVGSDEGGVNPVGVPAQMQESNDRGLAHDDVKPEDTTQGDRPARPVTCSSSAKPRPSDCPNVMGCGWHHVRTEPDIGLYMCSTPNCPYMARALSSTDLGSGK